MTPFDTYIDRVNNGHTAWAREVDLSTFTDRELDRVYEAEVNDWADTEPMVPDISFPCWCRDIGRTKVLTSIAQSRIPKP